MHPHTACQQCPLSHAACESPDQSKCSRVPEQQAAWMRLLELALQARRVWCWVAHLPSPAGVSEVGVEGEELPCMGAGEREPEPAPDGLAAAGRAAHLPQALGRHRRGHPCW